MGRTSTRTCKEEEEAEEEEAGIVKCQPKLTGHTNSNNSKPNNDNNKHNRNGRMFCLICCQPRRRGGVEGRRPKYFCAQKGDRVKAPAAAAAAAGAICARKKAYVACLQLQGTVTLTLMLSTVRSFLQLSKIPIRGKCKVRVSASLIMCVVPFRFSMCCVAFELLRLACFDFLAVAAAAYSHY